MHGNVRVSSIFTTESGEWKLSGFEILSSVKDEDPVIYVRETHIHSMEIWYANSLFNRNSADYSQIHHDMPRRRL